MAVDNERPPLAKSDVEDKPVAKVELPQETQQSEDNEEDTLQMDSNETIDDSLKLTPGEGDDVAEKEEVVNENPRSRSSSRSRSVGRSSPEVSHPREEKSVSPGESKEKSETVSQTEVPKGETGRKWKIRKLQVNHSEQPDSAEAGQPKKRRWGTSQLLPAKKPALVISTDSLKAIVPDAKPLSAEEVRLGSPNFQSTSKSAANQHSPEESEQNGVKEEKTEPVKRAVVEVVAEALAPAKPEIVVAAAAPLLEAASPAQNPRSCILSITNLVRPFTINQLKELLARTGHLVDGKFWIDKVKSTCLVQYENEDEAEETRTALHGIHWPTSNPKTLAVDYSNAEELESRLSGKEMAAPALAKVEPARRPVAPAPQQVEVKRDKAEKVREWDLGKVGEPVANREPIAKDAPEEGEELEAVKPKDEAPAKLLDDLFRKTKTTPSVYWLPLTAEQIAEKEAMRRQRLAERETRNKEVQQRRDEEFQQRQREREKQREAERQRARDREREREKERERRRKRSRSSSSSSSSRSSSPSPNKRRNSRTPPRKR
nr:EOG090X0F73 [Macrothrix elegans]